MYIYKTTIYKSSNDFAETTVRDFNLTQQTDFETNQKANCVLVSAIEITDNAFEIVIDYPTLKTKVISPILWSDVKYIENNTYTIYLLSENIL